MISQRLTSTILLQIATLLFLFLQPLPALQFTTLLTPHQRFCFYEILQHQQKYTFVTSSADTTPHQIEVSYIDNGRVWKSVYYRSTQSHQSSMRVDKLAQVSSTFSFCIKNLGASDFKFKIQFGHGIEVQEFHALPDKTDNENLEREVNWIEGQAIKLAQKSENIQGLRRINQQISGMVGVRMVVFAVLGIVAIGAVNAVFYWMIKGELKKRKLI